VTPGVDEVLERLEEEGKKRGLSPEFIDFYKKWLKIQNGAEQRIGIAKAHLNDEAINYRLVRGTPLLRFDELEIDWPLVEGLYKEVVSLFAEYPDLFGELPKNLRELTTSQLKQAVRAWFKQTKLPSSIAAESDSEHLLLEAMLHSAVRPFLASHAKALKELINQEYWHRDSCPVCGGRADFSYLEKELGARWLLCSRCDTEWLFQRLQCPYCGNQNPETLAYFTDEYQKHRLYVCEQCHKYIKAVDLRHADAGIPVTLQRLLTIDIDRQAEEKGYQPDHADYAAQ
jgi:FdhE protein